MKLDGIVFLWFEKWEKMDNGVYKVVIYYDIIQFFIDDEMMINVCWLNFLWFDKIIFNSKFWVKFVRNFMCGFMIDGGQYKLVDSGFNVIGVMVVLNVGSFCIFIRKVLSYGKGQ